MDNWRLIRNLKLEYYIIYIFRNTWIILGYIISLKLIINMCLKRLEMEIGI